MNGRLKFYWLVLSFVGSDSVLSLAAAAYLEVEGSGSPPWLVGIVGSCLGYLAGQLSPSPVYSPKDS